MLPATSSMLAVISSVRSSWPAVASRVACARSMTASLLSRSPVTAADVWLISRASFTSTYTAAATRTAQQKAATMTATQTAFSMPAPSSA